MLRSALILSATLIAASSFGCVVAPTPVPSGASGPKFLVSEVRKTGECDAGKAFASRFATLSFAYDPSSPGNMSPGTYTPPSGVQQIPASFASDLADAYCAASTPFQQQLDNVNGFFITCANPAACAASGEDVFANSWGFRENIYNQSALQRSFIALSAQLWAGGAVKPYSDFENSIINNLLAYQLTNTGTPPAVHIDATPNTKEMTLLAALAHEIGHVQWWRLGIENHSCKSQPFYKYSWARQDKVSQFHGFGREKHPDSNGNGGNVPKGNRADKDQIISDIGKPQIFPDLHDIYSGYWASMFATVSPDEDFVETYKIWTLMNSGLSSLTASVAHYAPADIVGTFAVPGSGYELAAKLNWVSTCFPWPK